MEPEFSNPDIRAAFDLGREHNPTELVEINGTPCLVIPNDHELKQLDSLRQFPMRIEKTLSVTDHKSFTDYFNRFATPDSTILVDLEKHKFLGILDHHADTAGTQDEEMIRPRNCKHMVAYDCPLTPEAKRWLEMDKKSMSQAEFAYFIETGMLEISEPSAAEMLEIATTLSAKTAVDFRSGIRLDNGQVQLTYNEEVQGSAGAAGQLKIPSKIVLVLQLFRGDETAYRIEANFRYRLNSGKLSMHYELVRPHVALEDAVAQIAEKIRSSKITGHMINAQIR